MTEQLGFLFHPSKYSGAKGPARLEINLPAEPTQRHFDPERAEFLVARRQGGIEDLSVTHPWRGLNSWQVAPGRIIVRDRKHKVMQAFSLGGELAISGDEGVTGCSLTSPAPIWPVGIGRNLDTHGNLVCCLEALIARRRAAWTNAGGDREGFDQKMASADPQILYPALLAALEQKMVPAGARSDQFWAMCTQVDDHVQQLEALDQWPPDVQLSDVL